MSLLDEIDVAVRCELCGEGEVVAASSLIAVPGQLDSAPVGARRPSASPPARRPVGRKAALWLSLPAALYRSVHEAAARRESDRLAFCRWEDDGGHAT